MAVCCCNDPERDSGQLDVQGHRRNLIIDAVVFKVAFQSCTSCSALHWQLFTSHFRTATMLLTHCSRLVTGLGAKQLGFLCGQAASSQFSVQVKSSLGKQKISCPIICTVLRVPQRSMVTHIDRIPYSEDFFIRQVIDENT